MYLMKQQTLSSPSWRGKKQYWLFGIQQECHSLSNKTPCVRHTWLTWNS